MKSIKKLTTSHNPKNCLRPQNHAYAVLPKIYLTRCKFNLYYKAFKDVNKRNPTYFAMKMVHEKTNIHFEFLLENSGICAMLA